MTKTLNFREPSILVLLFSNILTIILAVVFQWNLLTFLITFWLQSIIIGFFTVIKFFTAKIEMVPETGIFRSTFEGRFIEVNPSFYEAWSNSFT